MARRFVFSKVDIAPAHCLAYPSAENLRNGFVAGEARSQMALRKFYGDRVFNRAHKTAGQYWLKIKIDM